MKIEKLNLELFHRVITATCGGGSCPQILINDNGDALVQGSLLDESVKKGLNLPNGEDVVFVPKSIIQKFLKQNK